LLYKFFKIYFIEQEKKWINIVEKVHKKIKYYKDLCKILISKESGPTNNLKILETLNDVLFCNETSKENLDNHKKIIKELINILNQKREEILLVKNEVEIIEKEFKFWIHDFDNIKSNQKLREEISKINMENLRRNLDEELKHKR
jgi:hypothetical protein